MTITVAAEYSWFEVVRDGLVALIGTGIGAYAAFHLQASKEDKKIRSAQLLAGRQALVMLVTQLNVLEDVLRQALDPLRTHPARAFLLKPLSVYNPPLSVSLESLVFLLASKHPNALNVLLNAERCYRTAIGAVDDRSTAQRALQDNLSAQGIRPPVSVETIREKAPASLVHRVESMTDGLYECMGTAVSAITLAVAELQSALSEHFPGEKEFGLKRTLPPPASSNQAEVPR